jgi:predicted nucleic acid-binding Zn ribbon protein
MTDKKVLTKTEAAYIAGFMDGEGSFFCVREVRKENRSGIRYTFTASVLNTNFDVMYWIREKTNAGNIQAYHDGNPNHKIGYKLSFNKDWILNIVPQIMEFLVIKKRQAELVISGINLRKGSFNYSKHNGEELYKIYSELNELNMRGTTQKIFPFTPIRSAVKKDERLCGYPGCTTIHFGNGYCRKHYRRMVEIKKQGEFSEDNFHQKYALRKCQNCGAAIPDDAKADAKFCSKKCLVDFHSRKKRELTIAKVEKEGRQIGVCQQCGQSFNSKVSSARYCSDHCRSLSRAVGPVKKSCVRCGKEFDAKRPNRRMFCSSNCSRQHLYHMRKVSGSGELLLAG